MSYLTCKWINPNGERCDLPMEVNRKFCYRHLPMVYAGYPHTEAPDEKPIAVCGRPQTGNSADIIRAVPRRVEERHLAKKKNKKKTNKFRSTLWVEADFPRYIDGIFFQCLQEYEDFVYGQYDAAQTEPEYIDEMESVDQQASALTNAWLGKGGYRSTPSQARQDSWDMSEEEWDNVVDEYEKSHRGYSSSGIYSYGTGFYQAPKSLKVGEYKKLDTIMHMSYYIARGADGKYYAVWVSCTNPDSLDSIIKECMGKLPCAVTPTTDGRYHSSQGYDKYSDADGRFSCGGESFYNIRTRIDRAKDPDWIPPNIRKLAFEGMWDNIPAEYQKKAREWFDKGCPGWWGTWHSKHNNGAGGKTLTKHVQRGKGISVMKHRPKLLGPAPEPVLKDPRAEMQEFLARSSGGVLSEKGARPMPETPAKEHGCRMRTWNGEPCGKPVTTPPYCDTHNIQLYGYPTGRQSLQ